MEMARSNLSKAEARMKPWLAILGLFLLQAGMVSEVFADVQKIPLKDGASLDVFLVKNGQKYEAVIQPLYPGQPSGTNVWWSCEYHSPAGLHLAAMADGKDLDGKLLVTINTPEIRITADNDAQSGSIVLNCVNQQKMPRTASINVALLPEPSLGQNAIRLRDSRPVQIKLTPEGDHYRAKLDFSGASPFNCSYLSSPDWQLIQDGAPANGTLLNILPGITKVELVAPAAADKFEEFSINLNCGDSKGESVAELLVTAPKLSSRLRTTATPSQEPPAPRGLDWFSLIFVSLMALAIGGCVVLYWLLQKARSRQDTRIEFDDESLESSRIFDLVPGVTQAIDLRAPKGYGDLKVPVGKYVSVEAGEQHQDKAGAEGDAVHADREWSKGEGHRLAYNLTLKPGAKDSGAEILWFTAKPVEANSPTLAFPLFVRWTAPAKPELINNGGAGQPIQPAADLRAEILILGAQLEKRDQRLSRQLEGLLELLEHTANNPDGALEFRESLDAAKKEILESLYSEVNRATGDSLGEIQDAIKKQLCEDFSKQLSDIAKLVKQTRGTPVKAERGRGAGKSRTALRTEPLDSIDQS